MKIANVQRYEKLLQDRMGELSERLEEIEDDLGEPANPDVEERATEREGDEVLDRLGQAGLSEIKMIQGALARIADGTFGSCVACGEPISTARLDVLPHTLNCKKCA